MNPSTQNDFEFLEETELMEMENAINKLEETINIRNIEETVANNISHAIYTNINDDIINESEFFYQNIKNKKITFTFNIAGIDCNFDLHQDNHKHLYIISKYLSYYFDNIICSID